MEQEAVVREELVLEQNLVDDLLRAADQQRTSRRSQRFVLRGLGGTLPAASQNERFYALEALWRKSPLTAEQMTAARAAADQDI